MEEAMQTSHAEKIGITRRLHVAQLADRLLLRRQTDRRIAAKVSPTRGAADGLSTKNRSASSTLCSVVKPSVQAKQALEAPRCLYRGTQLLVRTICFVPPTLT
jgi:hypothetical protein